MHDHICAHTHNGFYMDSSLEMISETTNLTLKLHLLGRLHNYPGLKELMLLNVLRKERSVPFFLFKCYFLMKIVFSVDFSITSPVNVLHVSYCPVMLCWLQLEKCLFRHFLDTFLFIGEN